MRVHPKRRFGGGGVNPEGNGDNRNRQWRKQVTAMETLEVGDGERGMPRIGTAVVTTVENHTKMMTMMAAAGDMKIKKYIYDDDVKERHVGRGDDDDVRE